MDDRMYILHTQICPIQCIQNLSNYQFVIYPIAPNTLLFCQNIFLVQQESITVGSQWVKQLRDWNRDTKQWRHKCLQYCIMSVLYKANHAQFHRIIQSNNRQRITFSVSTLNNYHLIQQQNIARYFNYLLLTTTKDFNVDV